MKQFPTQNYKYDNTTVYVMDDFGNALAVHGDALQQWAYTLVASMITLH